MTKYSQKAQEKVREAMRKMKKGKLISGTSGKKVKDPKQAIAIGLSEARKSGAKLPSQSTKKTTTKKSGKKKAAKKSTSRKK